MERNSESVTSCRGGPRLPIDLGFGGLHASIGDHIGHFYRSREEWRLLVVGFLKAGLEASEKCVYLRGSDTEVEELRSALEDAGVDTSSLIDSGQLAIGQAARDPATLELLLRETLAEIPDKHPFLRWGGDMTWSLEGMPTSAALMEWETHCNVIEEPPAVFLCQYDLSAFDGGVVMDAMRTHPVCIIGSVVHQNSLYQEPQEFLEELHSRVSSDGAE